MINAVSLRDYSSQSQIKNNTEQSFGRKHVQNTESQEAPQKKKSHTGLYVLAGLVAATGLAFAFRKPLMNIKFVSDTVSKVREFATQANNKINELGGEKLQNIKEAVSSAADTVKTKVKEGSLSFKSKLSDLYTGATTRISEFFAKLKK